MRLVKFIMHVLRGFMHCTPSFIIATDIEVNNAGFATENIVVVAGINESYRQLQFTTIYYSLVQPYFDYCDVVWSDCSKTRADKLQKLQNRAARIITRADYSIRSSAVLNSLEWSNLEEREKRHLLITMFKVFNNNCPTYLQEYFHKTSEVHNYNLRGSNYDFQLPLPKTFFLLSRCKCLEPTVKSNT